MKKIVSKINRWCWGMAILTVIGLPEVASAQYFTYANGDLVAGFRKASGGSYELVVNVGNVSNFLAQPIGTVIPVANLTSNQLGDAFGNITTAQLQWSVSAAIYGSGFQMWDGFHATTIWFTLPRSNPGTPTSPPLRQNDSTQSQVQQAILTIEHGANVIGSALGTTGQDNNASLVREPVNYGGGYNNYSYYMQDPNTPSTGDYNGNLSYNVENAAPKPFSAALVSDLYQSVSTQYTNSGPADYIGYFTLNTNGIMTFTRAATVTQPPVPQITSVTRMNGTTTVYFTTGNGPTYALLYTNSAGLGSPVANWPSLPATRTGDGNTDYLSDATTDTNRFYRISAHY